MVSEEAGVSLTLPGWLWTKQGVCSEPHVSSALGVGVKLTKSWGGAGVPRQWIARKHFILSLWSQVQMSSRRLTRWGKLSLALQKQGAGFYRQTCCFWVIR